MVDQARTFDGSFDYTADEWCRIFETLDAARVAPGAKLEKRPPSKATVKRRIRYHVQGSLSFAGQLKALSESEIKAKVSRLASHAASAASIIAELHRSAPRVAAQLAKKIERQHAREFLEGRSSAPPPHYPTSEHVFVETQDHAERLAAASLALQRHPTPASWSDRGAGRPRKDHALALVDALVSAFEASTGLKAEIHVNLGKDGDPLEGPFLDFVTAVFQPLPSNTFSKSPTKLVKIALQARRTRPAARGLSKAEIDAARPGIFKPR